MSRELLEAHVFKNAPKYSSSIKKMFIEYININSFGSTGTLF